MKDSVTILQESAARGETPLPRLAAVAARANALYSRAVAYQLARQLDRAEIEYRRLLRLDPFDIEAHSNLGAILCQQGRIDDAQGHFARALELRPRVSVANHGLRNVA